MKTERIVLSIIAILIGLFVAGIVFYFFQMAKSMPEDKKHVISILPSPSPEANQANITITEPENEVVSANKSVEIKGKAQAGSTVVIASENGHFVVTADEAGSFTEKITLDDGVNVFQITAIDKNGRSGSIIHTISYSSESF